MCGGLWEKCDRVPPVSIFSSRKGSHQKFCQREPQVRWIRDFIGIVTFQQCTGLWACTSCQFAGMDKNLHIFNEWLVIFRKASFQQKFTAMSHGKRKNDCRKCSNLWMSASLGAQFLSLTVCVCISHFALVAHFLKFAKSHSIAKQKRSFESIFLSISVQKNAIICHWFKLLLDKIWHCNFPLFACFLVAWFAWSHSSIQCHSTISGMFTAKRNHRNTCCKSVPVLGNHSSIHPSIHPQNRDKLAHGHISVHHYSRSHKSLRRVGDVSDDSWPWRKRRSLLTQPVDAITQLWTATDFALKSKR